MSATDTTPHGGEIMQPPERRFPEPTAGEESDEAARGNSGADEAGDEAEIEDRPLLPDHPAPMAADDSDGETKPHGYKDKGEGPDRIKSLKKQRG